MFYLFLFLLFLEGCGHKFARKVLKSDSDIGHTYCQRENQELNGRENEENNVRERKTHTQRQRGRSKKERERRGEEKTAKESNYF